MDLGSIFLVLALLVLVGLFIGRPLYEPLKESAQEGVKAGYDEHARSALLAERDRVINALQELDFDHALGKIPQEDFPAQRALLLQQGAEALRNLDAMHASSQQVEDDVEARIETAIAARRAEAQAVGKNGRARGVSEQVAAPDDDVEVMLANRRRVRQDKATGFCHKCGGPLQKSDRFCPKCGTPTA